MVCNLIKTVKVENTLGECVLWDDVEEVIWWTDIEQKKMFSYSLFHDVLNTYTLPERLCSFGFIENSSSFLAAFETGIARLNVFTESVEWIERIYARGCGTRLNDGRVDRGGHFWVGAMMENLDFDSSQSRLFKYSKEKGLSIHAAGVGISNGLCWSLDGETQYFADSSKNAIYAYDVLAETGSLVNKRIFASTPSGVHPDGSCVDAEGFIWNAQWGGGQVVRYAPNGRVDYVLEVPTVQPTCVSFGGPKLEHLIITSARLNLKPQDLLQHENSGNLFIYETNFKGLKEQKFSGNL